ncbi:MAG: RNA-binding transcriptional accessory protein, partial [Muribaculaceae bacterium]|nr:RNA-binding transcriptional accessory protein [Muribaculaceae bacterium]
MAHNLTAIISEEFNLSHHQVEATIKLLNDGATIPFISRYRKEATGSLDEVMIRNIQIRHSNLLEIIKRKEYILETIESQGNLTDDLRAKIEATLDLATLEDIYLPFKPKRRTKAAIAREAGLEPLAKIIMAQTSNDIDRQASKFTGEKIGSINDAINGALDIIAEWVSESEKARAIVRN